jgi:hypothetical protein
MKSSSRILHWTAGLFLLLAGVVVFQRLRVHLAMQSELEQLRAESARLRMTSSSSNVQRERLAVQIRAAERTNTEPALNSVERRRLALATQLAAIKPAVQQRPAHPLVPAGRHGDLFPELLEDPAYAQKVQEFFRLQVEVNYAPWLRRLEVPAGAGSQVMKLLIEQYHVELDTEEAAVQAGLDLDKNRREVAQFRTKILQNLLGELQGILGAAGYADFMAYHATVANRASFDAQFGQRLSYSTEPLNAEQTNRIIAATSLPSPVGERARAGLALFRDVVVEQAKSEFTPAQWEQLEEYVKR